MELQCITKSKEPILSPDAVKMRESARFVGYEHTLGFFWSAFLHVLESTGTSCTRPEPPGWPEAFFAARQKASPRNR
jgi:hypothetical protein